MTLELALLAAWFISIWAAHKVGRKQAEVSTLAGEQIAHLFFSQGYKIELKPNGRYDVTDPAGHYALSASTFDSAVTLALIGARGEQK